MNSLALKVGNLSTNEAIFNLKYEILKVLNTKIYVAGMFCDLTKVLDDNASQDVTYRIILL
jgi:hypothetical protein